MKKAFIITNLVVFTLSLPFIGIMLLFGLAGADKANFVIAGIGYLGIFIISSLSLWRDKYIKFIFIPYCLMGLGFYLNAQFWKKHNLELCNQIRADKYCTESEYGFSCKEPSSLGNFSVAKGICKK
jgi:hypothetical protein